jgi:hypothetical protein
LHDILSDLAEGKKAALLNAGTWQGLSESITAELSSHEEKQPR